MTMVSPKTAAERDFRYTLTGPEIEVAEIIRLAHMANFSMTIEHRDGAFTVRLVDPTAGKFIEGHGASFEEAWRSLPGADLSDLTLGERTAARGSKTGGHLTMVETRR